MGKDSWLPAPPGRQMVRIRGRPLNVNTGAEYKVQKAEKPERLAAAFSRLLSAALTSCRDLHAELCIACDDDLGQARPAMSHVVKYGTFMADAIAVSLAARPFVQLGARPMLRR